MRAKIQTYAAPVLGEAKAPAVMDIVNRLGESAGTGALLELIAVSLQAVRQQVA